MRSHHLLLSIAIGAAVLSLAACKKESSVPPQISAPPAVPTADEYIDSVNDGIRDLYPQVNSAQWLSSTYINSDTQMLAAKSNEMWLNDLKQWIGASWAYEGQPMSPETARAFTLLKLMTSMPAPKDPARLTELTQIATRMEGMYGAGTYCTDEGAARQCLPLGELEKTLGSTRDYARQLDVWEGWHSVARPMRQEYVRFVELANEGARDSGFADVGEMWRSGYDMPPAKIAAETDRLWQQVEPLYQQLHCYARTKLDEQYGDDKGHLQGGLIPAHLLGNMWQQDWSNLWDLLQPYRNAGSLDITDALQRMYQNNYGQAVAAAGGPRASTEQLYRADRAAQLQTARQMTERAQDFYTSLGMPRLPDSYWQRSQFIKPLDRDVVCHASAWDMNMAGDVRTKMCIEPTEEHFTTIYHELGHIYYDLAYNAQPPLFQGGANDGFHEAIGDTIVLAMTPEYLHSIGLVDKPQQGEQALINTQMRMALAKVSFLPFGLMIDRWRWGVFDGSITPDHYNQAWWELKARYQGVAPVTARGEEFFDPGAKYHVPGNTPYTRYFLSHILQFQFYKSLCQTAGYQGPLHDCTFYGNEAAGKKFWAMLQRGSSQPWQATLQEMTGSDTIDAAPLLEYFAPLQQWLTQQNQGRSCGWEAPATPAPNATQTPAQTPEPPPQAP